MDPSGGKGGLDAVQSIRDICGQLLNVLLLILVGGLDLCGEDWPHWRGPHRNGTTSESSGWTGSSWLAKSPRWQRSIGEGSSSPLVAAGRVYLLGWQDERDHLLCLDVMSGETVWEQDYPSPRYARYSLGDKGIYSGPSSTPELDLETGLLYTLSTDGELRCWDTNKSGQLNWRINLYDRFDVPQRLRVGRSGHRDYGYTSSVLVYRDWLIVEAGCRRGTLLALDKKSGEIVWASTATDPAGHSAGPVLLEVEGIPCVAVHHYNGLLVVRMDRGHEGETLASYPWKTDFANNIASPAVHQNQIVLTSAYNHNRIARLDIGLGGAELVWEQELASKVCTPVIQSGRIYWSFQRIYSLDFGTGEVIWQGGSTGAPGSCILTGDDRLITWTDRGTLQLLETQKHSATQFQQLAARRGIFETDAWPHVVLSGGQLYLKDRSGNVACLPLK